MNDPRGILATGTVLEISPYPNHEAVRVRLDDGAVTWILVAFVTVLNCRPYEHRPDWAHWTDPRWVTGYGVVWCSRCNVDLTAMWAPEALEDW